MRLPYCISKQKSLMDLTKHSKFLIPTGYKRKYIWAKKEIDELFADILEDFKRHKGSKNAAETCLLGDITLFVDSRGYNYIIDGQQRLSTLFYILQYMLPKINKSYEDITKNVSEVLFNVDYYGSFTNSVSALQRESIKGNVVDVEVPKKTIDYINKKIEEVILYVGWDEEGEILNYLLDGVYFIVNSFQAQKCLSEKDRKDAWCSVLTHYYKRNTRGRLLSNIEKRNIKLNIDKFKGTK